MSSSNKKYKVAVVGAYGRMGNMLVRAVEEHEKLKLVGLVEREGHSSIGQLGGKFIAGIDSRVRFSDDLEKYLKVSDAIIDFTDPNNSVCVATLAAKYRRTLVIGTTGFTTDQLSKISLASRETTIVRAGNMSLGLNVLLGLARKVSNALDFDFVLVCKLGDDVYR